MFVSSVGWLKIGRGSYHYPGILSFNSLLIFDRPLDPVNDIRFTDPVWFLQNKLMDIKEYIDHFPEIAQRDRHEQFKILEQAQAAAFTPAAQRAYTLYSWLVPMLWIAGIGAGLYFTVGFASWVPVVALIAGLIISRIMINNRRETLMQNGLRTVLEEPS